jgi:hypothetical protein
MRRRDRHDKHLSPRLRRWVGADQGRARAHHVGAVTEDGGDPLVRRQRKGYILDLATWRRDI